MAPQLQKTVLIAAVSSDIGRALADLYLRDGWQVIGTHRSAMPPAELTGRDDVTLIPCDLSRDDDLAQAHAALEQTGRTWDLFISAVGQLEPIGDFIDCDRQAWLESVAVNGARQLGLLHAMAPLRRAAPLAQVAFLVGGAISRAFPAYSAYSLGKLQLVKFCELLHDEAPDIHAVAVGTGWVATRIHAQTLAAGDRAGDNLDRTRDFLSRQDTGTPMEDIKATLDWCFAQPREVTGGRNISVVHDPWRDGGDALARALSASPEAFRLRRAAVGDLTP